MLPLLEVALLDHRVVHRSERCGAMGAFTPLVGRRRWQHARTVDLAHRWRVHPAHRSVRTHAARRVKLPGRRRAQNINHAANDLVDDGRSIAPLSIGYVYRRG